jgi:hypothetical protein
VPKLVTDDLINNEFRVHRIAASRQLHAILHQQRLVLPDHSPF